MTLPLWLKTPLDREADVLGQGQRGKSGNQKIGMLSFSFYLCLDPAERLEMARRVRPAGESEEFVRGDIEKEWPVQALKVLARMTPDQRAQIMATAESMAPAPAPAPAAAAPPEKRPSRSSAKKHGAA